MRNRGRLFCGLTALSLFGLAAELPAQENRTIVAPSSAVARSATWISVDVSLRGDANGNGFTMVEAGASATEPFPIQSGAIPSIGPAGWRSTYIYGLTPGRTYWVRIKHVDPDGVVGEESELIGPIATPAAAAGISDSKAFASGVITIDGPRFAEGDIQLCSYAIGPDIAAAAAGATPGIAITAAAGCAWTAVSNSSWITVGTPSSGNGTGVIPLTIASNPGANARIGTVVLAGRTITITQSGQGCSYTLTPGSAAVGAGGETGSVRVSAPAGCSWTSTVQEPWLSIGGASAGSGNGSIQFTAAANTTGLVRAGNIVIGGRTFSVTQAAGPQGIACTVTSGAPVTIRGDGLAELIGDLLINCKGTVPAGGATLDITATVNTTVTSKLVSGGVNLTEAVLLVNDPASPVLGTSAYLGTLTGYSSLRWTGIPLAAGSVSPAFRIKNVRVNANLVSRTVTPAVVTGLVEVKSARIVTLQNASANLATVAEAISVTAGAVGVGPAVNTLAVPISYNESTPSAFKIRLDPNQSSSQPTGVYNTESGFVNAALGATVGLADSGTRLRMVFTGVPAGVHVYVPLRPVSGVGARLLSEDSVLEAGTHFNGAYQELPVQQGRATATWEIDSANATQVESRVLSVAFSSATTAQVELIRAAITGSLSPFSGVQVGTASPVPRFFDPSAPQPKVNLRISAGPVLRLTPVAVSARAKASALLATVGSNFAFNYRLQNDSSEPANDVVVRGNLPPGFSVVSCSAGTGGQCTPSDNEFTATYPTMAAGAEAAITLEAAPPGDLEPGYFIESTVTASARQLDTDLASNRASSGIMMSDCPALSPMLATVPAAGGSFQINVPACSLWTAVSMADWITIMAPYVGTSAGPVTYQVAPNPGPARTGYIAVAGQTFIVTQAQASAVTCTYSINPAGASVTSEGVKTTFNLTATGTNCSWTASSNATWAQVYPLNGTNSSTISYRVFPNFNTTARTATFTIGGQNFLIQQAGGTETRRRRFVRLLYFSFLGRVPSSTEVDHHANSGLSEAALANSFWNSDEFAVGGRLVAGLYVGLLERDAEYGGWQFQRLALADGEVNQVGLSDNFLNAAEFISKNGTLTDTALIEFLYRAVLGRTASPTEIAAQQAALNGGVTRAQLATYFLSSDEFRQKVTSRLSAFLFYGTLLMRDGSPTERDAIINELTNTAVSTIINRFAISAENALLLL